MLTGQLLQLRRVEITLSDLFGKAAMLFVRFRMNSKKSNVLRRHLIFLNETVPERCRGGTESALGTDLNRHDDKPRQGVDNQLDIIEMSRSRRQKLGVLELVPCEANGLCKANRELVMTGTAGIHASGFFFDDSPKL